MRERQHNVHMERVFSQHLNSNNSQHRVVDGRAASLQALGQVVELVIDWVVTDLNPSHLHPLIFVVSIFISFLLVHDSVLHELS